MANHGTTRRVIIRGEVQRETARRLIDDAPEGTEVVLRPHQKDKTAAQRNFWHMLIGIFAEQYGQPKGELKDALKLAIIGSKVVKTFDGREAEVVPNSEDEKRYGYSALIDQTYQIATRHGIDLPSAHTNGRGY